MHYLDDLLDLVKLLFGEFCHSVVVLVVRRGHPPGLWRRRSSPVRPGRRSGTVPVSVPGGGVRK